MTLSKSSDQGHTADALAPGADEGRGKLRKARVGASMPVIRRFPNEETHHGNPSHVNT